jgi:DNA polymerase-1
MGFGKILSQADMATINANAQKSKETLKPPEAINTRKLTREIEEASKNVKEYFKDSNAILIQSVDELHDYVTKLIESGYGGIDTETTGLDRINDIIVGSSLYYPGGVDCYIPNKHIQPAVDAPYSNQLTYEEVGKELQRIADSDTKLIFANADFDLAMIYKDYKVDLCDNCYYDVILAWRCIKENEPNNQLKTLYNKYVLKGKGDPKKFTDFFSPKMFPYCNPNIAKLYAANDAKITYELFCWQLPYLMPDNPKCKKHNFENIANLVWNIEFPLIKICQEMHRNGVYLEKSISDRLHIKYSLEYNAEMAKLQDMIQAILDDPKYHSNAKRPFMSGADFNPKSTTHVSYLLYSLMKISTNSKDGKQGTGKELLAQLNLPVTNQILKVRSLNVLISTFVEKLPNATSTDSRIHCRFNQVGAATGRLSSADPNMQNIPSKAKDIRRMFRATPSTNQLLECTYDDDINKLVMSLDRLYKVTTPNGQTYVKDLIVGDDVQFLNDNKEERYLYVKSIETSSDNASLCDVVFGLQ